MTQPDPIEPYSDLAKFEGRKGDYPTTVKQKPNDCSPNALIEIAVTQGADLDKLEKLLTLQERYEANEAKKAYVKAVTDFKAHIPVVLKDKENKQFNSHYVSDANLMSTINPALSKHGLYAHFELEQADSIKVSCVLTHKMGHSESTSMSAPPDTSGGNAKNPIQQIKSTVTYLRKITFEAITGIASTDPDADDDGNAAGSEFVDEDQLSRLQDIIDSTGAVEDKFLEYMGVEKLEYIPKQDFQKGITALKASAENSKK